MKPGDFVGADGLVYGVIQAIRVFEMAHGGHSAGVVCIDHPDFPAAVAALQSLIRPSLDPRSGRVLAMRERECEHVWIRRSDGSDCSGHFPVWQCSWCGVLREGGR